MSMRVHSVLLLALSVGCGKSEPAREPGSPPKSERAEADHTTRAPAKGVADVPPLEAPPASDVYDPSPSELPLTEDFSAAAEKRVTPGNYLLELVTIERELEQLTPKPASAPPKRATQTEPKRAASAQGVARK